MSNMPINNYNWKEIYIAKRWHWNETKSGYASSHLYRLIIGHGGEETSNANPNHFASFFLQNFRALA